MRVAILGGGFAGLSVAWYLLHYTQGSAAIDLYDPEPIAGGASGISSGLLHPFGGKQARRSWESERCLKETHRLLTAAAQAIGKPMILSKGIIRPALSDQQITDFKIAADQNEDAEWWDKKKCEDHIRGLTLPPNGGGLYIKEGLTVDVKTYLQGLWQACLIHGTQYHQKAVITQEALEEYDRVLIAMGPLTKNFPPLKDLPISPVKGQILELKWPGDVPPLPFSLISQKYIIMSPDHKSCYVGATYEHNFNSPKPDTALAIQQIVPSISQFFPSLAGAEVLNTRAAFRASSPNHLPMVGKISGKFYFFTGLGSKGLLYHAWVGKRVARAMLSKDPQHFPEKIHKTL